MQQATGDHDKSNGFPREITEDQVDQIEKAAQERDIFRRVSLITLARSSEELLAEKSGVNRLETLKEMRDGIAEYRESLGTLRQFIDAAEARVNYCIMSLEEA